MEKIASTYRPISLDEMRSVKLLNRTDTKFVASLQQVMQLLRIASSHYRMQETDGLRIQPYHTIYYDTAGLKMYNDHQHGQFPRQKVRIRSYLHSHLSFLEVKTKNNHRRTRKKRKTIDFVNYPTMPAGYVTGHNCLEPHEAFIAEHFKLPLQGLVPHLENQFNRITLVNNDCTERLTIDTGLRFTNYISGRTHSLDQIGIIELKRDGLRPSPILELLRQLRIKPHGFSKYCMGTAYTNPQAPVNLFKERLRYVDRIIDNNNNITR